MSHTSVFKVTVSRSRVLDCNSFLIPKPFSGNSRTADSKTIPFLSFQPFLAEKMALEVKKARFNRFVLPSDLFKSDGDLVYTPPHLPSSLTSLQ